MVKRGLVTVALIGLAFTAWYLMLPEPPPGASVRIQIERGTTVGDLGIILEDGGVISNKLLFGLVLKYEGVDDRILPGSYVFKEGISAAKAVTILRNGPRRTVFKVTIPEGFTVRQIAKRVGAETVLDPELFLDLAEEGREDFADAHPFLAGTEVPGLEGYLFPKTFIFDDKTTEAQLIGIMLDQFSKEIVGLKPSPLDAGQRPLHEIITIASLIEEEARVPEERGLISAVIHNRLRIGMSLQIDATVQYALPAGKERLKKRDLEVDSPYNTYKRRGLPPGPIASPGLASIKAAMAPADVDYLYYVLTDPKKGAHSFTRSYDEFLEFKRGTR
ncbi:MAG: endolytic transglycosylase MltG [Terriglobia bacterium]